MKNLKLPSRLKIRWETSPKKSQWVLWDKKSTWTRVPSCLKAWDLTVPKILSRDCPGDIYTCPKHTIRFVNLSIYFKIPSGKGITARKQASRAETQCFKMIQVFPFLVKIAFAGERDRTFVTGCNRGGDQAEETQVKYVVTPEFPSLYKRPLTCKWTWVFHLSFENINKIKKDDKESII